MCHKHKKEVQKFVLDNNVLDDKNKFPFWLQLI